MSSTADSREVTELHHRNGYDLIMLDMHMPHLDGLAVLDQMNAIDQGRQAAIIVMTGDGDIAIRVSALERGARDFLIKPANRAEMLSRIHNILTVDFLARENSAERARYRSLLRTMLPDYVIARLDQGEEDIVDDFDDVAILFADLVGFSSVCARLEPRIVLDNLSRVFMAIDELAAIHGIEKIKTIGDAYMAVNGLHATDDSHFFAMAEFALDVVAALDRLEPELAIPFKIRAGIERGSIIAGLVKGHRAVFDVWGDTVNAAARLQSSSAPGRVAISAHFASAVKDRFQLEDGYAVTLRNVGKTETYFHATNIRLAAPPKDNRARDKHSGEQYVHSAKSICCQVRRKIGRSVKLD
ncbi:MAG TPA: adenylate/guanylate cyclase domain-containing protein [Magnetospirillaceae bacterium]